MESANADPHVRPEHLQKLRMLIVKRQHQKNIWVRSGIRSRGTFMRPFLIMLMTFGCGSPIIPAISL